MNRGRIEAVVLLAALVHVFVAGKVALSRPDRGEAESLFNASRTSEEAGDFATAAVGFYDIYKNHPYAPQAAESGFRLARTLLRGYQKLDEAEAALEMVAEAYPGTKWGEESKKMLDFVRKGRQGGDEAIKLFYRSAQKAYGREKDSAGAKALLEELVRTYPNSSLVPIARDQIESIARRGAK